MANGIALIGIVIVFAYSVSYQSKLFHALLGVRVAIVGLEFIVCAFFFVNAPPHFCPLKMLLILTPGQGGTFFKNK